MNGTNEAEYTIVDDGPALAARPQRRAQDATSPTRHRDPLTARPSRASARVQTATGSMGGHNNPDDLSPATVDAVIRTDIHRDGPDNFKTEYLFLRRDGTTRWLQYTMVDDHGLRPIVERWWRNASDTPLRRQARAAGCH